MRTRRLGVVAALAVAGCASDKFFVLVSVEPSQGEVANVSQFLVDLKMGSRSDLLTYPRAPGMTFTLAKGKPVTFSIGIDRAGTVEVGVEPIDAGGRPLAYGTGTATLAGNGGTVKTTVMVMPGTMRPDPPDAGVGDVPDAGDAAPQPVDAVGCDPMARGCAAGQTCAVSCRGDMAVTSCVPGGQSKAGELCGAGCTPGTQCFDTGCGAIRTCLQYCRTDGDCGAGSRCTTTVTVPCGRMATNLKLCSRPCDPRGTAENGCARGLHCFLFENEVTDCACKGSRRTVQEGAACAQVDDCAPGLMCIFDSAGKGICRPLCRLSAPETCGANRTCTQLRNPDFQTYGACLPR